MTVTITNKPTNAVNLTKKVRVLNTQFGDGYTQRQADGINTIPEVWDLTFEYSSKTDRDALDAALTSLGGVNYFLWTPPYEVSAKKYICQEWSMPLNDYGSYPLQAKFTQVFEA
jgi:phage-related protein